MKKITIIISSLFLASLLYSCGTTEVKKTSDTNSTQTTTVEENNTTEKSIPLNVENQDFQALKDTIQVTWDKMILADDEKIASVARLLDEVSFNPAHDEKLVKQGREMLKELKVTRYTQETLGEASVIKYDEITDSTIAFIFDIVDKTPKMDGYPLAKQLITEIREANSANVMTPIRFDYNDAVKAYNEFLGANLDKVGDAKPLPDFNAGAQ